MERNIYNSSGKVIGHIIFNVDDIIICHNKLPNLHIVDPYIIQSIYQNNFSKEVLLVLWNEYTLTIGEIACLMDVIYSRANRLIKNSGYLEINKKGRRNGSFSKVFSDSRKQRMNTNRLKAMKQNGTKTGVYERTPEIKAKISLGVKKAIERGELNEQKNARQGWLNGKFANVNFKRGIGGYFTSIKTHQRFFFRSLLELAYLLILEEDANVETYVYEPFHIICDNGTSYTPDFLINNKLIVEIKSYKFIYKQGGEIQNKFEYKITQAKKYCEEHGYEYKVVFDEDIGFNYKSLKHKLKETNIIQMYSIEFLQPERVWSRK